MNLKLTNVTYAYGRFLIYLELILDTTIGAERKNFFLHEICKDRLWKYHFETSKEFASSIHMTMGHLYKRIMSAQVHLQMADAGLISVAPRGREVELLVKLPPEHRVDAWLAVIDNVQKHGRSHAVVRRALIEYAARLKPPTV